MFIGKSDLCCVCAWLCTYVTEWVSVYVWMCAWVWVSEWVYECVREWVWEFVFVYECFFVSECDLYLGMCAFYIHTYTYIEWMCEIACVSEE